MFSYVCWAAPTNVPINQLFGVRSGMGMGVLTFDWSQISWIGSPLMGEFFFSLHCRVEIGSIALVLVAFRLISLLSCRMR